LEKASQDQARHYNLRRRQWTPTVGDVVWAKEHHLSKAVEGFAAKLAPRYNGRYQVMSFASPVICEIRHINTKKKRTIHVSWNNNKRKAQASDNNKRTQQSKNNIENPRISPRILKGYNGKSPRHLQGILK